jgi:hypothetical protein
MPLLDLKSDLKLLKYGQDRPGGGNSGQPYIQNNINNPKDILGFDDGLVRGGAVGAVRASLKDTIRIGKWLKDFSKGPLWIVKQIGLQRSNPKLETLPGVGGFFGEPTRLYNLGINTLIQVPVNAFGVHFNRHGLLPIQPANTKYLTVAQTNNKSVGAKDNRLVKLTNKLNPSPLSTTSNILNGIGNFLGRIGIPSPFKVPNKVIYDYDGGPNSVYGLGRTLIRGYDNGRTPISPDDRNNPYQTKFTPDYYRTLGVSKQYFGLTAKGLGAVIGARNLKISTGIDYSSPTNKPGNLDLATYSQRVDLDIPLGSTGNQGKTPVGNASYQTYQKIINSKKLRERTYTFNGNQVNAFGIYGDVAPLIADPILPNSTQYPVYANGNNTNNVVKLNIPWNLITRENRIGSGKEDQINLTPLFSASPGSMIDKVTIGGTSYNINDLVKFRIQALDGNDPTSTATWMIFRAYVTQFSDNVEAKWNPVSYLGRGEEFYTYTGFSRKIQIGFKVAALSSKEMQPMYQKLNHLMSNLMTDYRNGLMRGPFVKMTIGNWIDGQDGILNSLSYTVPQDSPWEIGLIVNNNPEPLILPHIVEVSMTFTPIGSQTAGKNEASRKSIKVNNIAQDWQRNVIGDPSKWYTPTPTPTISIPNNAINPNVNPFEQNFGPTLEGLNLNSLSSFATNTNINFLEQNFGPTGG